MAPDTLLMEELTWTEIDRALDNGKRTAIFGVGSIEQHGPHLPTRMDTLAGDELALQIAQRLGDALVAPTIRPGCSEHHMDFPGTISISPETLMDIVRSYCECLDKHGFAYIVPIATHGGNFAPIQTVVPDVARDVDATIIPFADLDRYMSLMNEAMADVIGFEEPVIHAGAAETAIVQAVAPDEVRTDELRVGHTGSVSTATLFAEGFRAISETGVLGDPTQATEEAGHAIVDAVVDAYVTDIENARSR